MSDEPTTSPVEKQCRICLDGPEAEHELGRLISPCLCKGTVSAVHIKCLQRWRSASESAFFICPQCHYHYRFARLGFLGIATNPVVIGSVSTILFTLLTMLSSYCTTYFLSIFQENSSFAYDYSPFYYVNPFEVARDLVRAGIRILQDSDNIARIIDEHRAAAFEAQPPVDELKPSSTWLRLFISRFLIGLPLIGAASVVHMLYSLGSLLAPVHWVARFRSNQRRRNDSRDVTALLIFILLAIGTARTLYKVYRFTESVTKRLLLRAADAILEVT